MNTGEIEGIGYGISSAEEILAASVCKVTHARLGGDDSVYDVRMGSLHSGGVCVTCGLETKDCPGHPGCIELKYPILHPMFYKFAVSFIKCFCQKCFKFLLTEEHLKLDNVLKFHGESRFVRILEKIDKTDFCSHCETPKPKIIFVVSESQLYSVFKKTRIPIGEDAIKKIFDNVSPADVALLGFNPKMVHPKNMILTVLPVLPTVSRPWVESDGVTSDDDLTVQYQEIVKLNNNLATETNETRIQKLLQSLKFRIRTLMNNSAGKARHTNGKPIRAFKERLSNKDGLIRSNLMGKRVNQSGRTVIGPAPWCRTDELEFPAKMAATLTKPERVTRFNIDKLQRLVYDGKVQWVVRNGHKTNMKYVLTTRGTELQREDVVIRNGREIAWQTLPHFALRESDKLIRDGKEVPVVLPTRNSWPLRLNDVVHRQLQDGDIVVLNRQPTLHLGSMLGKRIVIREGKTLRFALATAKTFNADYDGDEMNIHVPQDYDATAEIEILSATKANMFSPQASKSNLSVVMDALLASYLMTRYDEPIDKGQFFNICMRGDGWTPSYILSQIRHFEDVNKELVARGELASPLPTLCGKTLVSMMLPNDFNYSRKNDAHPGQPVVKIYKGVMYAGALTKAMLGASHNAFHQLLYKEYDANVAMTFLDNVQFIGSAYLLMRGFSIGIIDCIPKNRDMIDDEVSKAYVQAKQISETINHPRIREARISNTLGKAKNVGQRIAKESMDHNNAFIATVTSGSKGDFFNIAQITGVIGQNELGGGRIQPVLNSNRRTLPHYRFEETDVEREFESRGFIKSSFMRGLNARETFLHAMSGREGVSDTAMKTSTTGYTQRKMIKLMEDLQIKYDGTVRNSYGSVVQWSYGEDGYDRSETVVLGDTAHVADLKRIADKLNTKYSMNK